MDVALSPGKTTTLRLTRDEMEALVAPVLQRCAPPLKRAMTDAGVERGHLSGVILVGGATRSPVVRGLRRRSCSGSSRCATSIPTQVVALGAAVQADVLAGGRTRRRAPARRACRCRSARDDGRRRREADPPQHDDPDAARTQTFTTYADNQTGFDLHVVQGEREIAADCRSLARFALKGIPPMPAGHGAARGHVPASTPTACCNVDGQGADDRHRAAIEVKPSYGLTDDEVEQMLIDSFDHAEDDLSAPARRTSGSRPSGILAATRAGVRDATPSCSTTRRATTAIGARCAGSRRASPAPTTSRSAPRSRRSITRPSRSPSGG